MDRFFNKISVEGENDCWNWIAAIRNSGYGCMKFKGKLVDAHRVSWILHNGDIPSGMFVCHKCDNRKCVNPRHLFLGTRSDNMIDAYKKGRLTQLRTMGKAKGSRQGHAKLTEEIVLKIKEALKDKTINQSELARLFGVHRSQIYRIRNGESWRHV